MLLNITYSIYLNYCELAKAPPWMLQQNYRPHLKRNVIEQIGTINVLFSEN